MKLPSKLQRGRRLIGAAFAALIVLAVVVVATGRAGYVVTEGISMQPTYHTGDLVVIERSRSYHTGEIVAYHGNLQGHFVVLHRIVGGDASGWVIKGDNNQSTDPIHPTSGQIIGRAVLHIPAVGAAVKSPITLVVLILVGLALVVWVVRKPAVKAPAVPAATQGPPLPADADAPGSPVLPFRAGEHQPAHRLRRPGAPAAGSEPGAMWTRLLGGHGGGWKPWHVLAGVDVLLGITFLASFAFGAAPSKAHGSAFTQTGAIGYQATVPASATYPTGHIATGDPVFIKLIDRIGVSFSYSTTAPAASVQGTAQLDAVVSTASGWHTNVAVVKPTPLAAGAADLSGTLDLAGIQAVATSVALATGVGAGSLTITLNALANISLDGAKPIAEKSQLLLSLSPLEMVMTTGKASPSANGPAVTTSSPLIPPAPVHHSSVPHQIRLGLLGALLLMVAITIVAYPASAGPDAGEGTRDDDAAPGHIGLHVVGRSKRVETARAAADPPSRGLQ